MRWCVSQCCKRNIGNRSIGRSLDCVKSQKNLDHWYDLTADVEPGYLCADALGALLDDLNTPKAFAALHDLRGEAAKGVKPAAASLKASAQLIGLLQLPATKWAAFRPASLSIDENKS